MSTGTSIQRLNKNIGGYFGETIDIQKVLKEIGETARQRGWQEDAIWDANGVTLTAHRRLVSNARKRVYISCGIHGDEPAGPLAARRLVADDQWPGNSDVWLCPCLNPTGFLLNRRENAQNVDLNRDYLRPEAAETRTHVAWLERQPQFDIALCLHEDWEANGFYIYELNPEKQPSLAEGVIRRVAEVCPIDSSAEIEGREAKGGIIRPSTDPRSRPDWPEAFYLFTHKTRLCYTLEAPSDFPLAVRVEALVAAVRAVWEGIAREK